jgi:hypothetical protein
VDSVGDCDHTTDLSSGPVQNETSTSCSAGACWSHCTNTSIGDSLLWSWEGLQINNKWWRNRLQGSRGGAYFGTSEPITVQRCSGGTNATQLCLSVNNKSVGGKPAVPWIYEAPCLPAGRTASTQENWSTTADLQKFVFSYGTVGLSVQSSILEGRCIGIVGSAGLAVSNDRSSQTAAFLPSVTIQASPG